MEVLVAPVLHLYDKPLQSLYCISLSGKDKVAVPVPHIFTSSRGEVADGALTTLTDAEAVLVHLPPLRVICRLCAPAVLKLAFLVEDTTVPSSFPAVVVPNEVLPSFHVIVVPAPVHTLAVSVMLSPLHAAGLTASSAEQPIGIPLFSVLIASLWLASGTAFTL